uniref:DUF676 domain-containing protein n=1 Tax=Parastrongyloides trichosuri TaxID=131310 RepID=A0A0N4ZPK7_PARTI
MYAKLYPEFKIWLRIDEFFNIDLYHRACYAVKIIFSDNIKDNVTINHILKDSPLTDDVHIEGEVTSNCEAISRYKAILYKKEYVTINDVFSILYKSPKKLEHFTNSQRLNFEIQLLSRQREGDTNIPVTNGEPKILCTRKLSLILKIDSNVHLKKIIYFDSNSFAAVGITIYTSLISINIKKKITHPDLQQCTNKLKYIYQLALYNLLSSYQELKKYIYQNASMLNGVVLSTNEEYIDITKKVQEEIDILIKDQTPWIKFENDIFKNSEQLNGLFEQVLFLFKDCKKMNEQLHEIDFSNRLKKLGEGFFYWEDSIISAVEDNNDYFKTHEIIVKKIEKSKYYKNIPKLDFHCYENDPFYPRGSIILEHIFSPVFNHQKKTILSTSSTESESPSLSLDQLNERSIQNIRKIKTDPIINNLLRNDVNTSRNELSLESSSQSSKSTSSESVEMMINMINKLGQTDENIISYVIEKENLKNKLLKLNFQGLLYSEKNTFSTDIINYFSSDEKIHYIARSRREKSLIHLIVFVHGLEGSSLDLQGYMNFIELSNPECNYQFLHSQCNESETWLDIDIMGKNLLNEVIETINDMEKGPYKISFVAHSMGGLIIRSMFNFSEISKLKPYLHTILTLNSPHCGLMYTDKRTSLGINIMRWWKQSTSLHQLTLRDHSNPRESFIYKLSLNSGLSSFKNVLLVGDYNDNFVPATSALIETCMESKKDSSIMGYAYREIIQNLNNTILESKNKTLFIKYIVSHHCDATLSMDRLIGRSGHVAPVDNDNFIEKLICISAGKYFK